MKNKQAFAEIIQSSLQSWTGQTWKWDHFPAFGSLVTVITPEKTWIGIVHSIQTSSPDTHRQPFIYQKTEQELLEEQPHIFEFLQTTFECITLGFFHNNKIEYRLAPQPPKIHAFIQPCPHAISTLFFSSVGYLPLLFSQAGSLHNLEELLLALLVQQKKENLLSENIMYEFLEKLALLYGNDYRKLKLFSSRLSDLSIY